MADSPMMVWELQSRWGARFVFMLTFAGMDAIDGKQARRVGMASALGEMFDHGCDAINTTVSSVLIC